MAVSIDDLVTPLPVDGSAIRDDLIYLASLLGLTIPVVPSNPLYQTASFMGRWGTKFWNRYAIPAIRAQFGDLAAGDWATLLWRGLGVDRNGATYASAPWTFENRSGLFVDASAVGAVQVSYGGQTYTSQGPPPGSTGTLAIWPGGTAPYPQTVLTMQCDALGTAGNIQPNTVPGYPTALASGPPGVYVATAASAPPAGNPVTLASNQETDVALLARGRAARALGAPMPVIDKITAIILSTTLAGGIPVATNRLRIIGAAATIVIYCATPSGPTPGTVGAVGTELDTLNNEAQLLLSAPGLTVILAAADDLAINLGVITLYVTKKSNVTVAAATLAAQGALDLWRLPEDRRRTGLHPRRRGARHREEPDQHGVSGSVAREHLLQRRRRGEQPGADLRRHGAWHIGGHGPDRRRRGRRDIGARLGLDDGDR